MILGWTDDLVAGAMSIWANLGLGNFVACVFCLWYLLTRMNWHQAARKSTATLTRVESLSKSCTPKSVTATPKDSKKEKLIDYDYDYNFIDKESELVSV